METMKKDNGIKVITIVHVVLCRRDFRDTAYRMGQNSRHYV